MAKKDKADNALRSALMAESARLSLEIPALIERKRHVDSLLKSDEDAKVVPARAATRHHRAPRKAKQQVIKAGAFTGLSLQEAARKQLATAGEPLSGREIWPTLKAAGFKTASSRPEGAIHWALRKRQQKHKDVMLVEGGKWALIDWYTPEQRAEINRSLNGMAGRDRENHSAKTKRGMKLAGKRGVRMGAPVIVTDEVIEKLKAHIAAGDSAKVASAKENISIGSFYLARREKNIPGLDPLRGMERKRAIARAKGKERPDLQAAVTEGSVH